MSTLFVFNNLHTLIPLQKWTTLVAVQMLRMILFVTAFIVLQLLNGIDSYGQGIGFLLALRIQQNPEKNLIQIQSFSLFIFFS